MEVGSKGTRDLSTGNVSYRTPHVGVLATLCVVRRAVDVFVGLFVFIEVTHGHQIHA